ncbi:MAG: hypothetical protein GF334_05720 [Candidatus Altiarchaeales archaeon]|nr:hypothetical protein [Candidatus Altiarchaeales archaeon]
MDLTPLHGLPKIKEMWGYDHAPNVFNKVDKQWQEITGDGSFVSGLLRLVSNYKGKGKFSRGPDSWISLDTVSVGIVHWWADTIPPLFKRFALEKPDLAEWAWGKEASEAMKDTKFLEKHLNAKRGKFPHNKKFDWLLSGWYEIARHPEIIEICADHWLQSYVPPSGRVMKKYGWRRSYTKAGLIRITNSRGAGGMSSMVKRAVRELDTKSERKVLPYIFEELYKKPRRWEKITTWPQFKEPFEKGGETLLVANRLDFVSAPIIRVDGSTPRFVSEGNLLTCRDQ